MKEESKFEEKILYINRCSKVVKGGRRFSFSALVLVGNGNGQVGYGFAKANEVADAIKKATQAAHKNVIRIVMDGTTIPYEVVESHDGAVVLLKPAPEGKGIVAGSKVRSILNLAGVKDIVTKSQGSNNAMNQVLATFKALLSLKPRKELLKLRGIES